jgi:hypothetical protein
MNRLAHGVIASEARQSMDCRVTSFLAVTRWLYFLAFNAGKVALITG